MTHFSGQVASEISYLFSELYTYAKLMPLLRTPPWLAEIRGRGSSDDHLDVLAKLWPEHSGLILKGAT